MINKTSYKQAKGLGTGLLLLFAFGISGQSLRFKKAFPEAITSYHVMPKDSYYYVVGQMYDVAQGVYFVRLPKFSNTGNLLDYFDIKDSTKS